MGPATEWPRTFGLSLAATAQVRSQTAPKYAMTPTRSVLTDRIATEGVFRIFVSSTFVDMRAERDILARKVFPSIRRSCEQRGVAFADVDLRWGITAEEAAEGQVLSLCLSEIDRCRPGFLILVGERYGWIPPSIPTELTAREPWLSEPQFRGASVTELEIQHGLLRSPDSAPHALCYIRSSGISDDIPEPASARIRLSRLKQAIRDSGCLVRHYASDNELFALASADLERLVDTAVPRLDGLSPAEQERRAHAAYASGRSRVFIDPPEGFDTLEAARRGVRRTARAHWRRRFREDDLDGGLDEVARRAGHVGTGETPSLVVPSRFGDASPHRLDVVPLHRRHAREREVDLDRGAFRR